MRSPPQKVTGYRYEEETACEQRPRDFQGGTDPLVSLSLSLACVSPRAALLFALLSQLLFFDASSFLIAANRDVKTIRALLLDSEPDAQFFSRYRSPLLVLSLAVILFPLLARVPEETRAFQRDLCMSGERVNNVR